MSDGTRDDKAPPSRPTRPLSPRGSGVSANGSTRSGRAGLSKSGSASRSDSDVSGFARGMRMSAELVGGVIVGVVFGLLLDRWLGTSPWGLLVFLLLGFAAGVLNVMRTAGLMSNGGQGSN